MSEVKIGCDLMNLEEREEAGFVSDSDDEPRCEISTQGTKNEEKNFGARRSLKPNIYIDNRMIRVHTTRIQKLPYEARSVSNFDLLQFQEPGNLDNKPINAPILESSLDKDSSLVDEKTKIKMNESMDIETNVENVKETHDIGPNTQIAAEAIEALFHGFPLNCEHEEDTCLQNASTDSNSVKPSYIKFIKNNTKEVTGKARSKRKKEESDSSRISLSSNIRSSKYSNFQFDVIPAAPRTRRPKSSKISSWKNVFNVDENRSSLQHEAARNLHELLNVVKRTKRSTSTRKVSPKLGLRITAEEFKGSYVISPLIPIESRENSIKIKSISKELSKLGTTGPVIHLRKRKYMSNVCVLFSSHLNEGIVKQQKKILTRFGVGVVSKVEDATHFVADRFTRTKNMLEAIAMGKPIMTHMWLSSCAQVSYFVGEKNYILRDAKKEKEYGFSMPDSLARACKHPLFKGRKIIVTPNVKPDKLVVESLIKAAQGQIQTMGSFHKTLKNNISDDTLVVSCEEDYAVCSSFLSKGIEVYHSDLILNGIIVQKLELDRYRLYKPC